jgi:hypothetical protein
MTVFWAVVGLVLVIIWIITVVDIVHRRAGLAPMAAWIMFVLIVPVIGAAVYWGTRKTTPEDLQRSADTQRELRRNSPYDPT